MRALRLQIVDPGWFSLKHAARAAIVMPAVVAFADNVIQDQQTTFLSAFGSVAILVLTDFGGPPRTRHAHDDHTATNVARCARQALATGDDPVVGPAVSLLWAGQHLDNLRQLGGRLIQPAAEFSSKARP